MHVVGWKIKYRQVILDPKPRRDVWDGEFEYELKKGDTKKALAVAKVLKLLIKHSKKLVKEGAENETK